MKICILTFTISLLLAVYSYKFLNGNLLLAGIFISGILFGTFLMMIKINSKNNRIDSYKRELEKESVSSDEAAAKVKVLESKIKVLEKALENALNK